MTPLSATLAFVFAAVVAGATDRAFVLPDGWTLAPAGRQVPLPAVPLNLLPSHNSKSVHVGTSSLAAHELSVIELETGRVLAKADVKESWYGLARLEDGHRETLVWSNGPGGLVHLFWCDGSSLRSYPESQPAEREAAEIQGKFRSGIAAHPSLYMYAFNDMGLGRMWASTSGRGPENFAMEYVAGKRPLDVAWSRDGHSIYVSDWADNNILVGALPGSGPVLQQPRASIEVGQRPNQIAIHPNDRRVFVACAGSGSVSVIDGKTDKTIETIVTALFPIDPQASIPDALALSPDGNTLYVANAADNCVAVVDVSSPGMSAVKGFIPTGWYPSAVAVTPDGETLLIGSARAPDTISEIAMNWELDPFPLVDTMATGELSILPIPHEKTLAEYTAQVHKYCPSPRPRK